MSIVLNEPGTDLLRQLLPCNLGESADLVILAVQVNYFSCGGMAIGICIGHKVADGSAAASFVKTWAAFANYGIGFGTELGINDDVLFDCTHLFPPQNILECSTNGKAAEVVVAKRFVFDGSKLATLRNEIGNINNIGPCIYRPTRVEAVTSLIWNALIKAAGSDDTENGEIVVLLPMINNVNIVVNLRKRMNPPLPQLTIGNIYHIAVAKTSTGIVDSDNLAEKVHESIMNVDDKYIRQVHGSGEFSNAMKNMDAAFLFSSWCRFPFYETDFGWGKPLSFGTCLKQKNVAVFVDTSDCEGIEAWIVLSKEEMTKLEKDPGILAYASFNPTI